MVGTSDKSVPEMAIDTTYYIYTQEHIFIHIYIYIYIFIHKYIYIHIQQNLIADSTSMILLQ